MNSWMARFASGETPIVREGTINLSASDRSKRDSIRNKALNQIAKELDYKRINKMQQDNKGKYLSEDEESSISDSSDIHYLESPGDKRTNLNKSSGWKRGEPEESPENVTSKPDVETPKRRMEYESPNKKVIFQKLAETIVSSGVGFTAAEATSDDEVPGLVYDDSDSEEEPVISHMYQKGGILKPVPAPSFTRRTTPIRVTTTRARVIETKERDDAIQEDQERDQANEDKVETTANAARAFEPVLITREQRRRAELAKQLHECMGHPSSRRLVETITSGKLVNCYLTAKDVKRAEDEFGRCRACEAARAAAPKARPSESQPAERVGERVHVDVLFTKGRGDKKQKVLLSVDEYSGFIYVVELPHLTKH